MYNINLVKLKTVVLGGIVFGGLFCFIPRKYICAVAWFSCSALGRFPPRVTLKQRGESFWPRSSPSLDVLRKRDKKRGPKASRPEEFISICRCCSGNGSITTPPTDTALGKRHPHRSRDALKQKGLICSFCAGRSLYLMSPNAVVGKATWNSFIHSFFFFFSHHFNSTGRNDFTFISH